MENKNKDINSYKDMQILFDEIHNSNDVKKTYLRKMIYAVRYLMKRLTLGESRAFDFTLKWCHVYMEMNKKVVNFLDEYQNAITIAVSYIIGCLQFNNVHINNYHTTLLQAIEQLLENAKLTTLQDIGNLSTCTLMCLWNAIDYVNDFNTQFMIIKLMSIILKFSTNENKKNTIIQEISTSSQCGSTDLFSQIVEQASHYGIFQNGIRDLLNKYNTKSTKIRVLSLHCETLTFGNNYSFYKPLNTDEFWLDFNYDSYTLSFEGRFKSNIDETCETVQVSVKVEHLKLQSNTLIIDFCAPVTFSKVLTELEELKKETKILLQLSEEETQRLNVNYSSLQRYNMNALIQRRSSGLGCIRNDNNNDNDDGDETEKRGNKRRLISILLKDSEEENRNSPINLSHNNRDNLSPTTQNTNKCSKQRNTKKSLEALKKKRNYNNKLNNNNNNVHNKISEDSDNNASCSSHKKPKIQTENKLSTNDNDSTKYSGRVEKKFFKTLGLSNNTEETDNKKQTEKSKQRKPRTIARNAKKSVAEQSEQNQIAINESNGNNGNDNYDEILKQNPLAIEAALNSPTLQSTILDNCFQSSLSEKRISTRKRNNSNNNNTININCSNNEALLLSKSNENSQQTHKNLMSLRNLELLRDCGQSNISIFSSTLNINRQTVTNNNESLLENSISNWNEINKYNENSTTDMDVLLASSNQNNIQLMTPNIEIMHNIDLLIQQNFEEEILTSTPLNVSRMSSNSLNTSNERDVSTYPQLWPTSQIRFYIKRIRDITHRVLNQYECQKNEMYELKQNIGQHIKQIQWLYRNYKKRTEKFECFRQNIEYILRLLEINLKLTIADKNNNRNTS